MHHKSSRFRGAQSSSMICYVSVHSFIEKHLEMSFRMCFLYSMHSILELALTFKNLNYHIFFTFSDDQISMVAKSESDQILNFSHVFFYFHFINITSHHEQLSFLPLFLYLNLCFSQLLNTERKVL